MNINVARDRSVRENPTHLRNRLVFSYGLESEKRNLPQFYRVLNRASADGFGPISEEVLEKGLKMHVFLPLMHM